MVNKHIKDLLKVSKKVIIPDFGAFVVKRSASGDVVSFNEFVKFNDGELVSKISEKESVSVGEALKLIQDFVLEVHSALDSDGKYEIEGVGYLSKDAKGNLRFLEDGRSVAKPIIEEPESAVPKYVADHGAVIDVQKKRIYLYGGATLAVVVLLVLLFMSKCGGRSDDEISLQEKHAAVVSSIADEAMLDVASDMNKSFSEKVKDFFASLFGKDEDEVKEVVEKVVEQKVSPLEFFLLPNHMDTIKGIVVVADDGIAPKGQEKFYAIAASFLEKKNAQQLNKNLMSTGVESSVFERINGFYAVSQGTFSDIDEALLFCGASLDEIPDIWILVK